MTTPDEQFERELELFRTEAEAGAQFFYADLAMHSVAADHKRVLEFLNESPLFWRTCSGALQTATFIARGRVFDTDSPHNVSRLLRIAQDNPQIFSKAALGRRRQGDKAKKPEWLDEFLRNAYEARPDDFRRLRAHIKKRRRIWESNYQDLRHKVFAHKALSDRGEIAALFAKTNIRELQRLFAFLESVYEALWHLFFNGRKPVLRPLRYSVKRMRALPSPKAIQKTVQEEVTHEAEQFLKRAAGITRQSRRVAGSGLV